MFQDSDAVSQDTQHCPRTLVCVLGQQCPELSQDWARNSSVSAHLRTVLAYRLSWDRWWCAGMGVPSLRWKQA